MNTRPMHIIRTLLILTLVALCAAGCTQPAAKTPAAESSGYGGALETNYENALNAANQLALGTLRLEGTPDAITQEQAAALLPLWQALQANIAQGTTEHNALLKQIETTMTPAQVSAIAAMRLTQEDMTGWMQEQGIAAPASGAPGSGAPGGGTSGGGTSRGGTAGRQTPGGRQFSGNMSQEQTDQMRQQFQNMSPEERATRRAQFGQGGGAGAGMATGTFSRGVTGAVVALLRERSGAAGTPAAGPQARRQQDGAQRPPNQEGVVPPAGQEPAQPSSTAAATTTVTATVAATATPAATVGAVATATTAPGNGASTPTPQAAAAVAAAVAAPVTPAFISPALTPAPNPAPGPPFTVQVSANRAWQDPLVEKSKTYLVTGIVRNDGDETYAVSDIHFTFYDASGFRGTFDPAIRDGKIVGGEWNWHGQIDANFDALLLAPGEEWPFAVSIVGQDMASFLIQPDAAPTGRESAPVELSGVRAIDDGTGYVRIRGTATNVNAFKVNRVTLAATLLDASGQIVSVGSTYVVQDNIAPGATVDFDLRVARAPYVSYHLYAQAERDWQ